MARKLRLRLGTSIQKTGTSLDILYYSKENC